MSETKQVKKRAEAKKAADPSSINATLAAIAARAAKVTAGQTTFTETSALNELIGVPSPSLAFSYLIQCNTIPFSRVGQLVGLQGSGKSALMAGLMMEVMDLSIDRPIPGSIHYNDNEPIKSSLPLFNAIFGHRLDGIVSIAKTKLMEEWQSIASLKFDEWFNLYDKTGKDKFGWRIPLAIGTDSLMSTCCRETLNKVLDVGHANKAYPAEANLLAQFARTLSYHMANRPILFLVTNHLKPFVDKNGYPTRNIPGGMAFKYMESFELELTRDSKDIQTQARSGFVSKIKAYKNTVGESRRAIEVPFVWEFIEDPTDPERKLQYAMWDWPGATVNLLKFIQAKNKTLAARIDEVLYVREGGNKNTAWSETLGVPKSAGMTNHELGCMIEERPDLLDALYPIMNIHRGRFFYPGMDYEEMIVDPHAQPDPQSARVFRRPACGNLGAALTSGELDVSDYINLHSGFEVEDG